LAARIRSGELMLFGQGALLGSPVFSPAAPPPLPRLSFLGLFLVSRRVPLMGFDVTPTTPDFLQTRCESLIPFILLPEVVASGLRFLRPMSQSRTMAQRRPPSNTTSLRFFESFPRESLDFARPALVFAKMHLTSQFMSLDDVTHNKFQCQNSCVPRVLPIRIRTYTFGSTSL